MDENLQGTGSYREKEHNYIPLEWVLSISFIWNL